MAHPSSPELLVLHAVRLKGFADTDVLAARFDLGADQTREDLLDAQARGWVTRSSFADLVGWSLTAAGRERNEAQLREELDGAGARDAVAEVHDEFLPLNAEVTKVFTAWQLAPAGTSTAGTPLRALADIADRLRHLEQPLTAHLSRFAGYHRRFTGGLARANGSPEWITGTDVDSCHRVWFELHEDLIATLNLRR